MKSAALSYLASFAPYRRVLRLLLSAALLGIAALTVGHLAIRQAASGRTHDSTEPLPHREAALVLGCARTLANGRDNLYFRHRITAAAALYHSGKVEYLVVSGDNHRHDYDEPTDMRDALVAAGVPAERVYRDYAGFRTLDSEVRAREIFGQTELIIVSQAFHNERAIFIAREHGIDAAGYNARDVASVGGLRTRLREHLAKLKTVLDVWVPRTPPKHLGPPVLLGGPVT